MAQSQSSTFWRWLWDALRAKAPRHTPRRFRGMSEPRRTRPVYEGFETNQAVPRRTPLLEARTWACQLQSKDDEDFPIEAIGASNADVVIIDYSHDGSAARAFTPAEVARMKERAGGEPKKLVAYMSIGEAEETRFYWKKNVWTKKSAKLPAAPRWLYRLNEFGWTGNWRIKFWDPEWQRYIIDDAHSFLNQIIDAGFDGVFLDIVDACDYWEDEKRGPDRKADAAKDMIAFVGRIGEHARNVRGKPGFLVIPNGDVLIEKADYRALISALMREDTIWEQDGRADEHPSVKARKANGEDSVETIKRQLENARADRIPILAIEYLMDRAQDRARIADTAAKLRAISPDILPYFSVRNLHTLCAEYAEPAIASAPGNAATRKQV